LGNDLILVKSIVGNDDIPWRRTKVGEGSKGGIYADIKILRATACRTVDGQETPHCSIWLYIRKYENGDIKFFISNADEGTTEQELHEAATLRWPIEQCFQECKSYLGMEHCEGRSYTGLLRHWLFVMIAHLFTTSLRIGLKKQEFL
jgi:SRSO17 transposase